jgi:hypothetical protein
MDTDDQTFDDESSSATGTLDPGNAAIELAAEWNGLRCEKCEAPIKSDAVSICRRCGWYASLGQFVEVDQQWEAYDDEAETRTPAPAPSHLEVWAKLLPKWAWIIIGTMAAVVVESIVVRIVTPNGSAMRTNWSLTQLVVGVMAFASLHVLNFLFAIADDADTGALDLILRPLRLWFKAFKNMPTRLWVTTLAAAGLTAATMSVVVIGGLPYERLWDWGFKQPPKQNLLGAVASQLQKVEGDGADNLEDAVADFASKQNLEENDKPTTPPALAIARKNVDCVILGYRDDGQGKLMSLILGAAHKGKLVYATTVTPKLDDNESRELLESLAQIRSDRPYLATQMSANWVKPMYACRVSCEKQDPQTGRLIGAIWQEQIGKVQ